MPQTQINKTSKQISHVCLPRSGNHPKSWHGVIGMQMCGMYLIINITNQSIVWKGQSRPLLDMVVTGDVYVKRW